MRWNDVGAALRRHGGKVLAAAAVLGALLWWGFGVWAGPKVVSRSVVRRDFVQTVVASGHVESPHRIDLGAQITGSVVAVPVAEGQTVAAGAVLVRLDSTEARAAEAQAASAWQQARARLRQVEEAQAPVAEQALRQAQVTRDVAQRQWERQRDLKRQGFIGEAALDDARKAADLAEAQWQAARKQAASSQPGGSDDAVARTGLTQASAALDAAHARAGYLTLTAPRAGTLIARNVEVGDVVQPGKVLMTLSPSGATQLVVEIDEKNMHLLSLGQLARASADAYPQQRFDARLAYINPGVNAQTGAVQVKLDVAHPPPTLVQDMTVSVDIEVARHAGAVLVPLDAVHDDPTGSPWAWRLSQGRAQRQTLRTGLRSAGWVEVLAGLQPGDRVLPADAGVRDGQRVRARADTDPAAP